MPAANNTRRSKRITQILVTNLHYLMETAGLSIREVVERSGLSRRMVDYILLGKKVPGIILLDRLAASFGLAAWELLKPMKQRRRPGR